MGWSDIPPVLLGDVRAAGIPLSVSCPHCQHMVEMSVDVFAKYPDSMPVPELGHCGVRCTECGRKNGISVGPLPIPWVRYLRRTGQLHRLPFYGAMTGDDE